MIMTSQALSNRIRTRINWNIATVVDGVWPYVQGLTKNKGDSALEIEHAVGRRRGDDLIDCGVVVSGGMISAHVNLVSSC